MSDDYKALLNEDREVCNKILNKILKEREKNNGNPLVADGGAIHEMVHSLVKYSTGWNTGSAWPLQHGDGGYSASFLLIHPEKGFVFIKTDPVEEGDKVIPENGILRLPGGFHTQPGYFHPWEHAQNKFYETLGLDVLDVANTEEHWKVVTDYPDGEPLGQLSHPNRRATTYFGYISDVGKDALVNNPNGRKVVFLNHTDFIREAERAVKGEPSKLSRMPQQCVNFIHYFRDGMKPSFF